jgi:hypothetical protein
MRVYDADPREFQTDPKNKNKGTKRGGELLRKSLERTGAGRSIVVDGHGKVIAGNHTLEAAVEKGIPLRVIETDGTELVVVKRKDLIGDDSMDNPNSRANELALADNAVGQANLDWAADSISVAVQEGADFVADYFWPEELAEMGIGSDAIEMEEISVGDGEAETVTVERFNAGDTIMLGDHTLHIGSTTDDIAVMVKAWEKKTGFTARVM